MRPTVKNKRQNSDSITTLAGNRRGPHPVHEAVDLAILEGIRAAGALYEGKQGVGHDQPA